MVSIHRVAALGGMDLVNARFLTRHSPPHSHREFEIGVVCAGGRIVHCRGQVYRATEGSILAFAPGDVHSGSPDDASGYEYRAFLIPEERLKEIDWGSAPDEYPGFDAPVIADAPLARQLIRSHEALSRPGAESDRSHDDRLLALFKTLCSSYQRRMSNSTRAARHAVRKVRDHLHHHYADRIRLDALSRLAGLSVFHLIRIFRTETGLSPYAYLGQVRVHMAAKLLREGKSVSMVASATGFADQSHLTRLFKRLVGVPPGAYRRCMAGSAAGAGIAHGGSVYLRPPATATASGNDGHDAYRRVRLTLNLE